MNIYTEHLTFHTKQKQELINITEQVKAAKQKSGFHDGFVLISSLHSNSAIFVNDAETVSPRTSPRGSIASARPATIISIRAASNLPPTRICRPCSSITPRSSVSPKASSSSAPRQFIHFAELDGLRPKRVLIKIFGE